MEDTKVVEVHIYNADSGSDYLQLKIVSAADSGNILLTHTLTPTGTGTCSAVPKEIIIGSDSALPTSLKVWANPKGVLVQYPESDAAGVLFGPLSDCDALTANVPNFVKVVTADTGTSQLRVISTSNS